ncbi:MAG: hypothetical protein IPK81_20245 [Rhodospirillales bacterium]|nr:MAG: hypothetical protein IPK81_20245 [Rhodospirillales bacterium]
MDEIVCGKLPRRRAMSGVLSAAALFSPAAASSQSHTKGEHLPSGRFVDISVIGRANEAIWSQDGKYIVVLSDNGRWLSVLNGISGNLVARRAIFKTFGVGQVLSMNTRSSVIVGNTYWPPRIGRWLCLEINLENAEILSEIALSDRLPSKPEVLFEEMAISPTDNRMCVLPRGGFASGSIYTFDREIVTPMQRVMSPDGRFFGQPEFIDDERVACPHQRANKDGNRYSIAITTSMSMKPFTHVNFRAEPGIIRLSHGGKFVFVGYKFNLTGNGQMDGLRESDVYDVQTGEIVRTFLESPSQGVASWSVDSKFVATNLRSDDAMLAGMSLLNISSGEIRPLWYEFQGVLDNPQFSPSGKRLLWIAEGRVRVFSIA